MTKYEYKTITLEQKGGLGSLTRKDPDLESILNKEGKEGWRLCDIVNPSVVFSDSGKVVVVFEESL